MPYKKKPAPAKLSPSQVEDWNMNEEARYQSSLKTDTRTIRDIAPQVDTGATQPKDAAKAASEGSKRQVKTAEDIVNSLKNKKDKSPYKYFK
jgi:methyl-accepting chemotaxis protein